MTQPPTEKGVLTGESYLQLSTGFVGTMCPKEFRAEAPATNVFPTL